MCPMSARRNTETTDPLVCPVHAQGQRLLCFCQRLLSLEMVWKGQFGANEMAGRRELRNSVGKWCSGLAATLVLGSVSHL